MTVYQKGKKNFMYVDTPMKMILLQRVKNLMCWLETSYKIHIRIHIHSIQIAKDIVQKFANDVIKSQIIINEGITGY